MKQATISVILRGPSLLNDYINKTCKSTFFFCMHKRLKIELMCLVILLITSSLLFKCLLLYLSRCY